MEETKQTIQLVAQERIAEGIAGTTVNVFVRRTKDDIAKQYYKRRRDHSVDKSHDWMSKKS